MRQKQKELYNETLTLFDEVRSTPWLAEGMRECGYDDPSWTYGEALATNAYDLARARATAESTQLGATDDLYDLFDQAWPHFQLAMQISVEILQGQTEYLDLLGLHEARLNGNGISQITKPNKNDNLEQTLSWLDNFYEEAQHHPEITAILTQNGVPSIKLANDAARVEALKQAKRHQNQAIAARQQAVSDRNEAFKRLKVWHRRAQRAARIIKKEHAAQETTSASVEI